MCNDWWLRPIKMYEWRTFLRHQENVFIYIQRCVLRLPSSTNSLFESYGLTCWNETLLFLFVIRFLFRHTSICRNINDGLSQLRSLSSLARTFQLLFTVSMVIVTQNVISPDHFRSLMKLFIVSTFLFKRRRRKKKGKKDDEKCSSIELKEHQHFVKVEENSKLSLN